MELTGASLYRDALFVYQKYKLEELKMVRRTKVIREKVRNLSEKEAKCLLAQLIELASDSSFGDPCFSKFTNDEEREYFNAIMKIHTCLLLDSFGIYKGVSE